MDRRRFIWLAAGSAGSLWLAPATGSAASIDPWVAWTPEALRKHDDFRVRAIAHAILSPNPQNLQPWLCELQGEDRLVLRTGGERRLADSDLPDRQLTVGFGTFSELLVLAAEAEGYAADIALFPEGEPWPILDARPVAVFSFKQVAAKRDPLLDSLLERHTNRLPFDESKPVSAAQLETIRAVARWPERVHVSHGRERALKIQDITLRAWEVWMNHAPTREEVARFTRIGNAAIAAAPFGPNVNDAALAKAAGPVSFGTLTDPHSAQFQANREAYRKAVHSGWAHLWVTAPAFDRKGMFEAGRDWVRTHLKATALGLNVQPHSQALQDFPEIEPFVRELHETLEVSAPGRIHMLGRIGYGPSVGPSPRLPAEAHLA